MSGVAAGNGKSTTATLPGTAGVLGPYAAVNRAAPPGRGAMLRAASGLT